MARHLSSYSLSLSNCATFQTMRHDEIRDRIRQHFQRILDRQKERVHRDGPPSAEQVEHYRSTIDMAQERSEHYWDMIDPETAGAATLHALAPKMGLSPEIVSTRSDLLLDEIRKAQRDQMAAFLAFLDRQARYDFETADRVDTAPESNAPATPQGASLSKAVEEYLEENRLASAWAGRTADEKRTDLALIGEILGADMPLAALTKAHANEIKKCLQRLPKHRNKLPETRNLTLREAMEVPGLEKVAHTTVNKALTTYRSFFKWAVSNGHAERNIFEGLHVGRAGKKAATPRRAFSPEQLSIMFNELTQNAKGLVRNEDHKWATLIAMFTGARRNEVCQLSGHDFIERDGIWCFNITDEAEGKSLKTAAAKRIVPIHSTLIALGVLDLSRRHSDAARRVFNYDWHKSEGYGRNVGRWFNTSFSARLGIKSKQLAFHSFRHAMITNLLQAGVTDPIVKAIVGHEQVGVTQQVYFKDGYTVQQLKEGIENFNISIR